MSWSAGLGWGDLLWVRHGAAPAVCLDPEGLVRDVRWGLVPADLVELYVQDDGLDHLDEDAARTWALDRLGDPGVRLSKATMTKIRKALER